QLPIEEVLRAIEVGLGKAQVRFALTNGGRGDVERRLRLLHLFGDLAILDFGERLAPAHPIAESHADFIQPPADLGYRFHSGSANEIADDRHAFGHVGALHRCHFDGHRLARAAESAWSARSAESAATKSAATARAAASLIAAR